MDETRRQQIIRLLQTRDQHLDERLTRRGDSTAGFAHGERARSCPDCLANGRVMPTCETCAGRGVLDDLERIAVPDALPDDGKGNDPYAVEKVLPYGFDPAKHDRGHALDNEIRRLGAQTRAPFASLQDELADANDHPYGWELARRRMYATFDYGRLDAALQELAVADTLAYSVVHAVYVYGWQTHLVAELELIVDRGLVFISARMPDPIRAPDAEPEPRVVGPVARSAGLAARARRNQQIRALASEGLPPREIAAACLCSVSTVYEVLNGDAA